jgi:hypothetical protein
LCSLTNNGCIFVHPYHRYLDPPIAATNKARVEEELARESYAEAVGTKSAEPTPPLMSREENGMFCWKVTRNNIFYDIIGQVNDLQIYT